MNIFVGNLSFDLTDQDLRSVFEQHGTVASASVIKDKMTGRSRGFGFVEMPDKNQAAAAIQALNLADVNGRSITVNEARPRSESGPRGGGGGGRDRRDRW